MTADPDLRATRDQLVAAAYADPFNPVARFNLAVTMRLLGQLDDARALAQDALSLGAPVAPTCALLGLLDLFALRPRDALAHLRRAVADDPDHAVSWVYLGLAHGALDARAEALDAFDRALQGPAAQRLPALVQTRVAQQRDALADAPDAALLGSRCAVCAITEWITPDGPVLLSAPLASTSPSAAPSPLLPFDELVDRIDAAKRLVVLSGAGLSAESGLPTRKALWSLHARDEAVSVAGFIADPTALWSAARTFAGDATPAPNAAHLALARLPQLAAVVTQNIDGLHQRAHRNVGRAPDAVPVVELHGTFDRALCHTCGALDHRSAWALLQHGPELPRCAACRGPLRPDVVLFGEAVPGAALRAATELTRDADLLLVVGCAMDVAPASELPALARSVVELNRNPSRLGRRLGLPRYEGLAGETLAAVYARLAARRSWPGVTFPGAVADRALRRRVVVDVPPVGENVSEVRVVQWLAKDGAFVRRDSPVVVIETDKVDIELLAPVDGVLRHVVTSLDDVHPIGARLGLIEPSPGAVATPTPYPAATARLMLPTLPWDTARRAALVERLASWRHRDWLRPDRELLDETPEARSWLDARADEHRTALGGDLSPLRVAVFHDLSAAVTAWRSAPTAECAWDLRLAFALHAMTRRLEFPPTNALRRRLETQGALAAFCDSVWAAVLRSECARQDITPGARLLQAPLPVVFDLARSVLDGSGAARGPCPWAPLAAIFARGAWPFAIAPDTLGVYVPRAETLRAVKLGAEGARQRPSPRHLALLTCLPLLLPDPPPKR